MQISIETIRKVNADMIARHGKPRELTLVEKYADSVIAGAKDSLELKEAKKEFNNLSEHEQRMQLTLAKCRKHIRDFFKDPERVKAAFKKAWDSVINNKTTD